MIPTPSLPRYVNKLRATGSALVVILWLPALGFAAPAQQVETTTDPAAATTAPALPLAAASAIPRPPELQQDVQFWIRVYTEVTTNEGLLHDEWDLSIVYARLQFAPDAGPRTRGDAVDANRDRYVAALRKAADVLREKGSVEAAQPALGEDEQRVIAIWGARATPERLLEASRSLRFQLGQADRFRAGIVRSGAWESHIAETLANLGLPPEVAALPHVESSFNPAAYSKVGAAGLWQFMRSTGRRYMRVDDVVDERLDPFRATEAAAQLLAFNYRILGTWPLALTAYNHGAAGMRRARDAMGTDDFVTIARRFRGPTFGFASRNFYPSFLAALAIDQNPEKYFGAIERAPELHFAEVEMPGFARMAAVERAVGVPRNVLRDLNPALRPAVWDGARLLPRGYRLRLPGSGSAWTSARLAERIGDSELYAAQITERSHRVRRGDSLASVASRYGIAQRVLADLNGLASETKELRVGRRLRLPQSRPPLLASKRAAASASAALTAASLGVTTGTVATPGSAANTSNQGQGTAAPAAAASAAAPGAAPPPAATVYVVRAGDNLFGIAARVGLSSRELMRINRIRDPDFIFEGQRLRVATRPCDAGCGRGGVGRRERRRFIVCGCSGRSRRCRDRGDLDSGGAGNATGIGCRRCGNPGGERARGRPLHAPHRARQRAGARR